MFQVDITFEQIINNDDKQSINEIISKLLNNTQYAVEYRIRHRNGKIIWLLEQGTINETVDTDKKCIDGVLIDITARHEYEESLKQAKQEAEAALKRSNHLWQI